MKIVCIKNTAKNLDLSEITTIFSHDYKYSLETGKEYIVMGIAIYKDTNCPYYLIDENGLPDWYPYPLFSISDNSLPKNWTVKVYDKKEAGDILFLCGFKDLCDGKDYHDLLMNRDEEAMRIYFRRKIEFEKEVRLEQG